MDIYSTNVYIFPWHHLIFSNIEPLWYEVYTSIFCYKLSSSYRWTMCDNGIHKCFWIISQNVWVQIDTINVFWCFSFLFIEIFDTLNHTSIKTVNSITYYGFIVTDDFKRFCIRNITSINIISQFSQDRTDEWLFWLLTTLDNIFYLDANNEV